MHSSRENGGAAVGNRYPGGIGATFTPMPTALQDNARAVKLSGQDVLVVMALERHRWTQATPVYPGLGLVAAQALCCERTAQRCLRKLERLGFLVTTHSPKGNAYRLDGLWRRLAAEVEGRQIVTGGATDCPVGGDRLSPPGVTDCRPKKTKFKRLREEEVHDLLGNGNGNGNSRLTFAGDLSRFERLG